MSDQLSLGLDPLERAIRTVRAGRWESRGIECPCCDQLAKVYRRSIGVALVNFLSRMVRHHELIGWDYIKVADHIKTPGGDYAKLRYWGLIERRDDRRDDGSSRCGLWRVTRLGLNFARGATTVRSHVFVYNGEAIGFDESSELVSISDVAGKRFDFQEIMETR